MGSVRVTTVINDGVVKLLWRGSRLRAAGCCEGHDECRTVEKQAEWYSSRAVVWEGCNVLEREEEEEEKKGE